jgi:hypothetical protein
VPDASSRGIFLSYRRDDTAPYARSLQLQLRGRFPDARVFMDLDSIEAGLDFAEVIEDAVDSCAVLVALIGPDWVTIADEEGHRRLDDPNDFVRFEIHTALERGVRVIPVLVDGTRPLRQEQLPAELHKLARLNAQKLSNDHYRGDTDQLLDLIQRVLDAASNTVIASESMPVAPAEAPAVTHDVRPDMHTPGQEAQKDLKAAPQRRPSATRLLIDAKRAADSITDTGSKSRALAAIARALAATDPGRAARLAAEAESAAQFVFGDGALVAVAVALAATDPDRAERIAQSITDEYSRPRALADVAVALAAADPDRAERIARSITSEGSKSSALVGIAGALAVTDPDRAERIAQSITDEYQKASALADVAKALAVTDPDRAERIAQSITSEDPKASALATIARALAATEPDRAAWLAADVESAVQSVNIQFWNVRALADSAVALTAIDPDGALRLAADAERMARSFTDEYSKANALADVALALAVTDPDRAEHIAQSITHEGSQANALVAMAVALAVTDPDRAERIAQSITDEGSKSSALAGIAGALAVTDPDRAEHIAQSITDGFWKVEALVAIVETQVVRQDTIRPPNTEEVTDKCGEPDAVDSEEVLQVQASLVTAWSESRITVEGERKRPVVVRNASELPVHDVQTWLYLPDRYPNEQLQMPDPPERRNSTRRATVEPRREFRRNVSVSGRGMETPPRVGVKFCDANGNLWWRDFNGSLHHLRVSRTV